MTDRWMPRLRQGELFELGVRKGTRRERVVRERRREERKAPTRWLREELSGREPVLVTMPLVEGLPPLRTRGLYEALFRALREGREGPGYRMCVQSTQDDHLHLVVEAESREALAAGQKGLGVRVARAVNRSWGREGAVFAGRFHARVLRTPREVRTALAYVLHNAWKHRARAPGAEGPDPYSSGPWFDGWEDWEPDGAIAPEGMCAEARTWLLRVGWWQRWGRLSVAVPEGFRGEMSR